MTVEQHGESCVQLRWMSPNDMPEVMTIERACFEFPWSEIEFLHSLQIQSTVCVVAELDGRVVGFMVYELSRKQIQLLNFATAPAYRRRGVGAKMAARLLGKLAIKDRTRISLEVRETNLTAQLFFRSLGFLATKILHNYYDDTPEDAYLMQYRLSAKVSKGQVTVKSPLRDAETRTGPAVH
jgi:[ribosomal protein S18]-alanine N-acetyltransferase